MRWASGLLILVLTLPVMVAEAQDAKAVITDRNGNKVDLNLPKNRPGGAAFYSAKMSTFGEKPTSIIWEVEPEELAQLCEEMTILDNDGNKNPCIHVPYGNDFGSFTVRLYVSKGDTGSRAKVEIGKGDGPHPPTPPDPDNNDQVPSGELGLTKAAYIHAMRVNDPNRRQAAAVIANNWAAVAAENHTSVESMMKRLQDLNRSLIPQNTRDAWNAWRDSMREDMDALASIGKLRADDVATHKRAFNAIAAGLRLVKDKP